MAQWILYRKHVSATDLGTANPWIPETLVIEAKYFVYADDDSGLMHFKGEDHAVVYSIAVDQIREVRRMDAKVHKLTEEEKAQLDLPL